eukprot:TRINITY_DN20941_c0_g1_i1.p1 TRINITY_DN20941_c0_g1~~TRINITY_DN20941_c0_g1_i1.p1  ORF type:complete len:109 (+),score=27.64 TRINITY_DN20941_c0_g1_i1:46-327(+)
MTQCTTKMNRNLSTNAPPVRKSSVFHTPLSARQVGQLFSTTFSKPGQSCPLSPSGPSFKSVLSVQLPDLWLALHWSEPSSRPSSRSDGDTETR